MVDRATVGNRSIVRTNGLPPAEEDAVDLEPKEVRVGVPPARRRHGGGQRHRRVELRQEAPRLLALGRAERSPRGLGSSGSEGGRGGGGERC